MRCIFSFLNVGKTGVSILTSHGCRNESITWYALNYMKIIVKFPTVYRNKQIKKTFI